LRRDDDDSARDDEVGVRQQADTVCKDFNVVIKKVSMTFPRTPHRGRSAFSLNTLVPLFHDQIDKLRTLTSPADSDQVGRCGTTSTGADQLERKLKDDPAAAFSSKFDPFGDGTRRWPVRAQGVRRLIPGRVGSARRK
jgi:hypothetical protein